MSWSKYAEFLAFAIVLVLIPGPDFAVVTRNTLVGGRRRGRFAAAGVGTSNAVQGAVAVSGLSAVILRAQPVFAACKWAGVCYLAFLGIQALRSAVRGRYEWPVTDADGAGKGRVRRLAAGIPVEYHQPEGPDLLHRRAPAVPPARRSARLAAGLR